MKTRIFLLLVLCVAFSTWGSLGVAAAKPPPPPPVPTACTTIPDAPISGLTAYYFNPTGTVSGTVSATALGCDVAVYYGPGHSGSVNTANISGEHCFGVVANGASVDVVNSSIPVSGVTCSADAGAYANYQFGIVYLNGANCSKGRGDGYPSDGDGQQSACNIQGNTITLPINAKDGVVAKNPGTNVAIINNTIKGYGPDGGIAQNGIEIGDGAVADIEQNTVSGNNYTGTSAAAAGILIYGGPGNDHFGVFEGPNYTGHAEVQNNTLIGNDLGVYLWNINTGSNPPKRTNNDVSQNNVSDNSASCNIFAAGITEESGNGDSINGNLVYGTCY
jgi:hypothetical protein